MKKNNNNSILGTLALFLFFLYSIFGVLNWSTLTYSISFGVPIILCLVGMVICMLIPFMKKQFRWSVILVVIAFLGIVVSNFDGMTNYLTIFLVAFCLSDSDVVPFAKAIFWGSIIGVLVVISLRVLGKIPDVIGVSPRGVTRISYGFLSERGLSEHYYNLIQVYIFIHYKKIKKLVLCLLLVPYIPLYFVNDARASAFLSALMVILVLVDKWSSNKKRMSKFLYFSCNVAYILCAFFSIVGSFFYNNSSKLWSFFDNLISGRFRLGHFFITNYPPKMLGQWLPLNLGKNELWTNYGFNYLMLDSGYLTMLLEAGIIIFFVFSILIMLTFKKLKDNDDNVSLILWLVMVLDLFQTRPLNPARIQVLQLSKAFSGIEGNSKSSNIELRQQ